MRTTLTVFLCLLTFVVSAQLVNENGLKIPRHQVKFSLLDMFDPYPPSFLFSYELPIAKVFAIVAEGGPSTSYNGGRVRGHKLRGEFRWYPTTFDSGDRPYLGLQVRLKNYKRDKTDTFCRDDCNYFQEMDYKLHSRIWAAHILFGESFMLGRHFVLDVGAFGGWRWAERKTTDLPPDAILAEGFRELIDFERLGRFSTPSLGVILRMGFGW